MDSADRVAEIVADLFEKRERGERVDPEEVIRRHPDLEDALRSHFEFADLLDDAVGDGGLPKGLSILARIERLSGTRSRVLLRETPDEESPLLRVPLAGDDDQRTVDDSRYHIAGEIARGGVGVVYKARDKDLGRDIALKVLRTEHHGNRDVFARFVEEAQIGAQLQHPGIVPVYGLGLQPDGRPCFAMKLVKGRTLADLLRERKTPLDGRRRFLQVFEHACQTIAYAHARGVIHRDLKPSNFMVGSFGEVQVVDWGFGKVLGREEPIGAREEAKTIVTTVRTEAEGSQSIAGSVMGTPAYMPPEQALGHIDHLDARSDVFALGAILCEILTGEPAYTGSGQDLLVKAAQADLADAYARLDACEGAADLVGVTRRALAPVPGERFRDAGELVDAVSAYLAADEERARRAEVDAIEQRGKLERARERATWEQRRRRRSRIAVTVVFVSVLLGGGVLFWADAQRQARVARGRVDVDAALAQSAELGGEGRWGEAIALARNAVALAGEVDASTLARARAARDRAKHAQAEADAESLRAKADRALVDAFERIREKGIAIDYAADDEEFAAALRVYGFPEEDLDAAALAGRVRARGIGVPVAAGLDEWARRRKFAPQWGTHAHAPEGDWRILLEAAMLADPDPWRNRLRRAVRDDDRATLEALARDPRIRDLSPSSAVLLATNLLEATGDAARCVALLRPVQENHPGDYWLNMWVGLCAHRCERYDFAFRFQTAALAVRPEAAIAWSNLSATHLAREDPEAALAAADRALELQPDHPLAHRNRAAALSRLGRYEQAIAAYRRAIELGAPGAGCHYGIGNCLRAMRRARAAVDAFREAVRIRPDHAWAWTNLGITYRDMFELDRAVECFREALRHDPDTWQAREALAWEWMRKGQLDEAAAELRRVIELAEEEPMAHALLSECLSRTGKDDEAIASCRRAMRLRPDLAVWHVYLGDALLAKARRGGLPVEESVALEDAARAAFEKALGQEPNPGERMRAHYGLARIHEGRGDAAAAALERQRSLAVEDATAPEWAGFGMTAYNQFGDARVSEGAYRRAIAIDDRTPCAHFNLGNSLRRQERYEEALDAYRAETRAFPGNQHAWLYIASTLAHKMNRPSDAIPAYEECIRRFPKSGSAHVELAGLLFAQGRLRAALEPMRAAARLEEESAVIQRNLGVVCNRLALWEEAREAFERAAALSPDPRRFQAYVATMSLKLRDYQRAETVLRELRELEPKNPWYCLYLGRAIANRGSLSEAVPVLREAMALGLPAEQLSEPPTALIARLERSLALEKDLDAVLADADRVAREDFHALAKACARRQRHVSAMRFYDAASREGDASGVLSYNVACAAVRAAAGDGVEPVDSPAATRADALRRLRAHLERLRAGLPGKAESILAGVADLDLDPDFDSVREPRVAKLPAEEAKAWRGFWNDVGQLRADAEEALR